MPWVAVGLELAVVVVVGVVEVELVVLEVVAGVVVGAVDDVGLVMGVDVDAVGASPPVRTRSVQR